MKGFGSCNEGVVTFIVARSRITCRYEQIDENVYPTILREQPLYLHLVFHHVSRVYTDAVTRQRRDSSQVIESSMAGGQDAFRERIKWLLGARASFSA